MKVLLVDDEEDFVSTLAERLKMRGIDVRAVLSGERALAAVDDDPPQIVVLDLKMPGIDGLNVLHRIRRKYPGIRVIVLTGHGSEQDRESALRCGAFDYLRKPVDIEVLMRSLKDAALEFRDRSGADHEVSGFGVQEKNR